MAQQKQNQYLIYVLDLLQPHASVRSRAMLAVMAFILAML